MSMQWMIMVACGAVFFALSALMLVCAWVQHRKADANQPNFHGSLAVELTWTVTPLLMTAALAWPAVHSVLQR